VYYFGKALAKPSPASLEWLLNSIDWKHDEAIIFGKKNMTKERWPGTAMTIFHTPIPKQPKALPWTSELLTLKKKQKKYWMW
jgi:hypothetical protein